MIFKMTKEKEKTNITNEAPKIVKPSVIPKKFSEGA